MDKQLAVLPDEAQCIQLDRLVAGLRCIYMSVLQCVNCVRAYGTTADREYGEGDLVISGGINMLSIKAAECIGLLVGVAPTCAACNGLDQLRVFDEIFIPPVVAGIVLC